MLHDGEKPMLEAVAARFRAEDPDLVCGYNVKRFDLPLIIRRMRVHGIPIDLSRLAGVEARFLEVENTTKTGTRSSTLVDIPGRVVFDPCEIVRTEPLRGFKLKDVAEVRAAPQRLLTAT